MSGLFEVFSAVSSFAIVAFTAVLLYCHLCISIVSNHSRYFPLHYSVFKCLLKHPEVSCQFHVDRLLSRPKEAKKTSNKDFKYRTYTLVIDAHI